MNGKLKFFNSLVGVLRKAVKRHHLFIAVRQSIVIIGGSAVGGLIGRRCCGLRG